MRMKVTDIEVLGCEVHGDGGFARLRRCEVRNVREDGGRSPCYTLDMVERPGGADAVTVVAYEEDPQGRVRVLLRWGPRPVVALGRAGSPTREGVPPGVLLLEPVAGILEPGDEGEDGLRRRAAEELHEEAGLAVDPAAVQRLGPPVFLSPGLMAERVYCCAVQADLHRAGQGSGDGSPLEEGSEAHVCDLQQALDLCCSGEIQDAKTELVLRRLAEALQRTGNDDGPI